MKWITSALVLFAVFTTFTGNLFAQSEATAEFLMIAPGARSGGLGEANVALANDAYASYWNPAGLAYIRGTQVTGMHADWLPELNLGDMNYDFAGAVRHFEGIGTLGLSATYINYGDQTRTDEVGNNLGTFSSFEYAIGLSYGTRLHENLAVGTTVKYIHSSLSPFSAGEQLGEGKGSSVALDLGLMYKPAFVPRLTFGMNLQNLGPKITFIDAAQADPIPTNIKAGFAYEAFKSGFNNLTLTVDFNKLLVVKKEDGTSDPFYKAIITSWSEGDLIKRASVGGGSEYTYSNIFALRAGYFYEDIGKRRFYTFGAGLRFSIYQFDFGYINGEDSHPLNNTMRFSLSFVFDKNES